MRYECKSNNQILPQEIAWQCYLNLAMILMVAELNTFVGYIALIALLSHTLVSNIHYNIFSCTCVLCRNSRSCMIDFKDLLYLYID